MAYRLVQPYGRDVAREATTLSEHATLEDAFAALDALAERMRSTGAPSDAITVRVVGPDDQMMRRPSVQ